MFKVIGVAIMVAGSIFTSCQGNDGVASTPAGCCKHGDRLDIVMNPAYNSVNDNGWKANCRDWGGTPVRRNLLFVCQGVDF